MDLKEEKVLAPMLGKETVPKLRLDIIKGACP